MQVNLIISIVNLIAIITLFILFFTKNNKENFTGVPSGYTNLLVSDPDGNLDTFSLSTLEADIDAKISALHGEITTELSKKQAVGNYQPAGNYQAAGDYALKSDLNNYYKYGDPSFLTAMAGNWATVYAHGELKTSKNASDYGDGSKDKPNKSFGFILSKAPAWDGGTGTVWKN